MDVPRNKAEFINDTILNTPQPQASSTVERRGVYSYRHFADKKNNRKPNEFIENEVPSRDTENISLKSNASRLSSSSSLGILTMDNIEDINDCLSANKKDCITHEVPKTPSNINEKLMMQRLLAQKTLEKADLKSQKNIGSLPSYLLKPANTPGRNTTYADTPVKNESTINLSDLERGMPKSSNASDKISFEADEITARSSSIGNQNQTNFDSKTSLRSPSPMRNAQSLATRSQLIYDRIRQSDISLAELCDRSSRVGVHTQPLGTLPLPDIHTISQSSGQDDSSWCPQQQDSFVANLQNELFTPAELAGDKLLADELSWRKAKDSMPADLYKKDNSSNNRLELSCFSGYIGDEDISLKSMPGQRISIGEFFKRRTEDVGDLDLKTSPEKKHVPIPLIDVSNVTNSFEPAAENEGSIESNDSPRLSESLVSVSRIADVLAQMDVEETPSRVMSLLLKKATSNKTNTLASSSASDGSTLKAKEYTPKTNNTASTDGSTLKAKEFTPKTNNTASTDGSTLKATTKAKDEWRDANAGFVADPPEHDTNGTISTVTESPSCSCSELEFSEDDQPDSANNSGRNEAPPDDWLKIKQDMPHKICKDVYHQIDISFCSLSNHWIHIKIALVDVNHLDGCLDAAKVELAVKEGLLKSYAEDQLNFFITSFVTGRIEVRFKIELTDMATKEQKLTMHTVVVDSELPKIKISDDILDFDLNPEESIKRLEFSVTNSSSVNLQLIFNILQEYEWVFVFGSETKDGDVKTRKSVRLLTPGETILIPLDMRSPALADLGCSTNIAEVKGSMRIHLSGVASPLREVKLFGRVGLTKVQFKTSCMPLLLQPGQTKQLQVRNSGVVKMELHASIADPNFTVAESVVLLEPNQIRTVNITFNPKERDAEPTIKSSLKLEQLRGSNFVFPVEGAMVVRSPDVRRSPRGPGSSGSRSSASSDSGTLSRLQDGKLPIEGTRTELVWGCVRVGETSTQEFVLRNRCMQRVRLHVVVRGANFRLVKDHSDCATSMSIMLHSLESRTIAVSFSPSTRGASTAKLIFLPVENEATPSKRQMILLYGYGGHSHVDVQKVAKDTSGRMWLSFGRLDYRDTHHQSFLLRNTGSLAAFACLNVCCKVLYPFMDSSVKVSPSEVVIEPNKEVEICVNFSPRPEDFRYIEKSGGVEVSEIASVQILCGPEPTRARIKRLFGKMTAQGGGTVGLGGNGPLSQLSTEFLVPRLNAPFPGERPPPADVAAVCREGAGAMRDLLRDLVTRDVALTVERATDLSEHAAVDDTCMFQSLVCANDTTGVAPNQSLVMLPPPEESGRPSGGFCTVEPVRLILTPPVKLHDTVLVTSRHSRPMPFEVSVPSGCVQASPSVGVVPPGDTTLLTLTCARMQTKPLQHCKVLIYVENEVMEIDVKIHYIQPRRS